MITRVILRFTLLGCLVLVSLVLPVNAAGTLAGTTLELPPVAAPKTAAGQLPDPQVWTTWGASQYALAEDGESIWIGATGGAVRWNRVLRSYRRYTAVDGLPHTAVLAVAVDAAGNRWFGGDGGLSRLDPGEDWTHFTAANSGLYADYVDAIAVGGSDTLYLSHGLPGGSVTRRAADGTWRWFPNRETAVQADYALIRQTRGHTRLWTVAGDEVWVGYRAYDGDKWTDRRPSGVTAEPAETAADSRHHFWALATGSTVYEWDGSGWSKHDVPMSGFGGKATALAVAADDRVWIGLQQREGSPRGTETARISQLVGGDSWPLYESGPVAALLPTSAGLWAIGPGWLMLPDRSVITMTDEPRFDSAVVAHAHLVGVLLAGQFGRREAGADLDALHRIDAHQRRGEIGVELAVDRRAEPGRNAFGDDLDHRADRRSRSCGCRRGSPRRTPPSPRRGRRTGCGRPRPSPSASGRSCAAPSAPARRARRRPGTTLRAIAPAATRVAVSRAEERPPPR